MTTGDRDYRLSSIDMLRGLVIVIMAIDHVRDFFMVAAEVDPMANPDIGAALFFTRWITHYCAPVFVFLAGTSAGLMTARRTPSAMGAFLLTRGVWLILIECSVIALAWSFAPHGVAQAGGAIVVPLGVIWVIGVSMVVLAGAQRFGQRACFVIGVAMILGHNLLDPIWPVTSGVFDVGRPLWVALHAQMAIAAGPVLIGVVYPLVPWPGVMLLGYGTALVFQESPERRDGRLIAWGTVATAAFVALRLAGIYGDPNPWRVQATALGTIIDFLNVTKYPPSLLFLLMTLGPAAVLCAVAGRAVDAVRQPLVVFGRVPFAFYVAHLYLAHALAVAFGVSLGFSARQFLTFSFFFPQGYGVGLPGVYAVWLLVIVALYPFCRWVAAVKARRRDWWLSYL
ncbi:putative membrane protein [Luteitalea pratensis]|uniref:Putative membrane protein n=1 Tax=Luteitalea pratensis TaxID=1855912 RepID=A0A143PG79_LUTPR|nr:heparan-alpha-glucosaminide N-acetyltransferase domain-containing protein [Luteitalea pratensis]AMY07270.1 putative membrane protein [Luteitalea pratensis]